MSNISVTVEWDQPTVFAGEELRCTVTFRNASISSRSRSPSPNSQPQLLASGRDRWKLGTSREALIRDSITSSSAPEPHNGRPLSHRQRSTVSLNAPVGTVREQSAITSEADLKSPTGTAKHNRSVSIISIASSPSVSEDNSIAASKRVQRIQKSHGRSASFQGLPLRNGFNTTVGNGAPSPAATLSSTRSSTVPSPLQRSATFKHERIATLDTTVDHGSHSSPQGSLAKGLRNHSRSGSDTRALAKRAEPLTSWNTRTTGHSDRFSYIGKHDQNLGLKGSQVSRPMQRMLSPLSMEGTPRSSVDLYTHSNHSSETMASEYLPQTFQQHQFPSRHARQGSHLAPSNSPATPSDTLMMGYIQLLGSFTLDGSLVTLAPFEAVKRKGVIGGQGSGGVVGIEHQKREGGLFGSLGWGNFGQSLGGLLGSQEPSSIREMKGLASTKSIPILSTPQSILFVDLKLSPGESRTYSYRHLLPEGLPPTHKGRAFKSSYQLVVGVQRPHVADKQHMVRRVDVPFRVLPGIDSAGEVLGHDLMNPHIVLKDIASTYDVDMSCNIIPLDKTRTGENVSPSFADGGLSSYVENLLRKSRQNSNLSLLSPTEPPTPNPSTNLEHLSMKERIDTAILRGGTPSRANNTANRFQIHRDGVKIANVVLGRSVYRLGETIMSTIDTTYADIPCYAVNVSLETSEVVDPAIALRSEASITRATRRVHASCSEVTVSARKIVLATIIPLNATPEFSTSGMRLEWKLRFEFITGTSTNSQKPVDGLLESVHEDERGRTAAAVQELPCQSFDVAVPVRVYGIAKAVDDGAKPQVYII